jgi:hypothetical protein
MAEIVSEQRRTLVWRSPSPPPFAQSGSYVAVGDEASARDLERYFKSGSGKVLRRRCPSH